MKASYSHAAWQWFSHFPIFQIQNVRRIIINDYLCFIYNAFHRNGRTELIRLFDPTIQWPVDTESVFIGFQNERYAIFVLALHFEIHMTDFSLLLRTCTRKMIMTKKRVCVCIYIVECELRTHLLRATCNRNDVSIHIFIHIYIYIYTVVSLNTGPKSKWPCEQRGNSLAFHILLYVTLQTDFVCATGKIKSYYGSLDNNLMLCKAIIG